MVTESDFNWNVAQSEVSEAVVRTYLSEPWTLDLDPFNGGASAIYTDGSCPVVGPLTYSYTIFIVDSQGIKTSQTGS